MRTGSGTKGVRHYDCAMLEVTSDDSPAGDDDGHSVLLIRRHRYTGTLSFYRCWTPGPAALTQLIAVAVLRWRIKEDHQIAKQATGLDAGQVIRWKSWHRWTALSLLAHIYLAVAAAVQRQHDPSPELAGLIPHHHPRTAAAAARHRHPVTPPGPCPQAALVILAATPPAPRPPGPPTLAHLRRDHNMITTNYSRRIRDVRHVGVERGGGTCGRTRGRAEGSHRLCHRSACGKSRNLRNASTPQILTACHWYAGSPVWSALQDYVVPGGSTPATGAQRVTTVDNVPLSGHLSELVRVGIGIFWPVGHK
jgi:hypothetical protein